MDTHALRVLEFDAIKKQLASLTACSLGRERAETLTPSTSAKAIQAQLDQTTECRLLLDTKGNLPLGGVTDIRTALRQSDIGKTLDPHGLLDVLGTAQASRSLKMFVQKIAGDYPLMAGHAASLGQFPTLESEISSSIALNGSILDTASAELARIRMQRKVVAQRMVDKLNGIVAGPFRTFLQDPVVVQRGDRYCVPVKAEHRGAFGGIVHDTSASGATLFVEPQAVVEQGNALKELAVKEEHEVLRILLHLTESVRRAGPSLQVTVAALGEIDFVSACAKLAQTYRSVEPTLSRTGQTRLRAARHPLIDPTLVVPIDVEIGTDQNRALLITGPNTGGKTVSLKTVGLLTLMAQSGLHVSADFAEINVFDQVFADIGDEQSLQQSLSTFSGHVSNIVRILGSLTPNSLVLLDEVGAGTDPGEGAALAKAIVARLQAMGAVVIATTHYTELKKYALTTTGVQNAAVEFDDGTLAPTYRLLQGIPGSSNAFAIAARLGVPDDILLDAEAALAGSDNTVDILRGLEQQRQQAVADARDAERARIESQMTRRRYQEELAALETLRREASQRADQQAHAAIRRAQDRFEHILSELRRANSEGRHTERARQAIQEIGRDLQNAVQRQNEEETLPYVDELISDRPLQRGDRVRIASLGVVGELLEDPNGTAALPVQVGAMRVSVPMSTLRLVGAAQSTERQDHKQLSQPAARPDLGTGSSSGTSAVQKAMEITPQIALLGQRAEEAVQNVEKYLDDAYAAGLTRVRVVHGKGTGALRRAIQNDLNRHALVASYETADPDEGGAGATIVHLKDNE